MKINCGFALEAYMYRGTETDDAISAIVEEIRKHAEQLDIYSHGAVKFRVMQDILQNGSDRRSFDKVVKSLEVSNQFKN